MLTVRDLNVSYGSNQVLHGISFDLAQGKILGLVGESGSGKSSVIRAIMGILSGNGRVNPGSVIDLDGTDLTSLSVKDWQRIRGTEISMIFQDSGAMMNPIRKIGVQFIEYIRLHNSALSKSDAAKRAAEMLGNMRLPDPANIMRSYPFQLSGGMRQRVGIAMAMTFTPKILLADEPTSALDATTQAQIARQMLELRDDCKASIILVTHNLGLAAYMSDAIAVLKDGQIVDYGDREKILHHPDDPYTQRLIDAIPTLQGEVYV